MTFLSVQRAFKYRSQGRWTPAPSASRMTAYLLVAALVSACGGGGSNNNVIQDDDTAAPPPPPPPPVTEYVVLQGTDLNTQSSPLLSLNPDGPGGSPNQSLRAGDVLQGTVEDEVLIGGLGADVLLGAAGDDVLIGGTEDFNSSVDGDARGSDNRDRAFGGEGADAFIWAPGDGSDFFDGGEGVDVLILGVLAEAADSDGSTAGAPFFNVNPPGTDGSQDFDGLFLEADTNRPTVRVSASPGFCTVLDDSTNQAELDTLELDHLVRFSLRAIADDFDAGVRSDDDGLRVSISLKNTEFLVCTRRDIIEDGGEDNIEVLDLTTLPPTAMALSDLPEAIQQLIE